MINIFRREDPDLANAIAECYRDLKGFTSDQKEHQIAVDQLVKLNALKNEGVNPNTLVVVAGNLLIGFAVIKYESVSVVTSKIWSFLSKI